MLSHLRRDRGFYKRVWALSLPLILQNLITTSLGFVDTFMVGLLGQTELSAVTAANSPVFLLQVIVFGLISGLTILGSQYWGKGDTDSINRCMGVAIYAGLLLAGSVSLVMFFFPESVMRLVTNNETLVVLGAPYLQIVGIGYIFNAVSSVYIGAQRSTENPVMGMLVFASSMLLNTFLNYCLIFGRFGAPALGVTGAAVATLASRIVEFLLTLLYALTNKRIPLKFALILRPGKAVFKNFVHYATPVLFNETFWGLGTTMMTVIMGHMLISEEMLAAYAIMGNIDKFATVACFGLAGAAAVIVGKYIGEGKPQDEVYSVSWCLLILSVLVGIAVALAMAILLPTVFIPFLYPLFHLEGLSLEIAITMCVTYVFFVPLKAFDITNITGVLRAGGDSRMAAIMDVAPLWAVAVPFTAACGLVFDAPIPFICFAVYSESILKVPWGVWRLRSRKWINDVTRGTKS